MSLVDAKTLAIQSKVWAQFVARLQCEAAPGAAGAAMACNAVLAELLREYGNVLYAQGASLFAHRHLIVFHSSVFLGLGC